MNVSPEVKAAFDKLKSKNDALKQRNADLLAELRTLQTANAAYAAEVEHFEPPRGRIVAGRAPVQTTQATAKVWKLLILAGGVGLLIGFALVAYGLSEPRANTAAPGVLLFVVGGVVWIAGRFGKFWFHE